MGTGACVAKGVRGLTTRVRYPCATACQATRRGLERLIQIARPRAHASTVPSAGRVSPRLGTRASLAGRWCQHGGVGKLGEPLSQVCLQHVLVDWQHQPDLPASSGHLLEEQDVPDAARRAESKAGPRLGEYRAESSAQLGLRLRYGDDVVVGVHTDDGDHGRESEHATKPRVREH